MASSAASLACPRQRRQRDAGLLRARRGCLENVASLIDRGHAAPSGTEARQYASRRMARVRVGAGATIARSADCRAVAPLRPLASTADALARLRYRP